MNDDRHENQTTQEEPRQTARPRGGTTVPSNSNGKMIVGIVVVAVIIVIAIFGPWRGDEQSTDTNTTTFTPDSVISKTEVPRSSDVDIDAEIAEIVPESNNQTEVKVAPAPEPKPVVVIDNTSPGKDGTWGVQVFASSTMQGAENYKSLMDEKGYRTVIHSDSDGKHRVWIGYFKTRDLAEAWKSVHHSNFKDKIMVKEK